MAHDYGRPELGPSFEEANFRSAFDGMGHEVLPFDFKAREAEVGRQAMNRELVQLAGETSPDLVFFFLYEHELAPETIAAVAKYRSLGLKGALLSQWACNKYAYGKTASTLEHDVTFVGMPHGNRRE